MIDTKISWFEIKKLFLKKGITFKRIFFCLIIQMFLVVTVQKASPKYFQTDQSNLNQILEKAAKYCERVKSIAMFYICEEEIQETKKHFRVNNTLTIKPYGSPSLSIDMKTLKLRRTRRNFYLYDYQLVNKEKKLQEKRTLLKKNNRRKNIKNAELEVRFNAQYLVYGPVGFLSRYWQNYFYYEIIGQEDIDKIPALIIKATPQPNNKENRNYAKICVMLE